MIELELPAMTCPHCVRVVTQAVQTADPAARVQADLEGHRVQVDTVAALEVVVARLTEAGYPPT